MGAGRNDASGASKRKRKFSDRDVDKMFLCGCSPQILFAGTKSAREVRLTGVDEEGTVADSDLKREWDRLSEREKSRYGYERVTMRNLETLIRMKDRQIEKSKVRIGEEQELEAAAKAILEQEDLIKEKFKRVKVLGSKGEVELAFAILGQIETLKKNIEAEYRIPDTQRQMLICPVSGNKLARADTNERLRYHFEGKQYIGWKQCRETLRKLKEKFEGGSQRSSRRERSRSPDRRRHDSSDRRDRSRSRERRHRSRSRERRHRSRSRERHRSRHSRTRSRSRERKRHRSRSPKGYRIRHYDRDQDDSQDRFQRKRRSYSPSPPRSR